MMSMAWRGAAGALVLVLAGTAGWSIGRTFAPHAVAQDVSLQDGAASEPQPAVSDPAAGRPADAPKQEAAIPPQSELAPTAAPDASASPASVPASAQERDSAHLAAILAPVALYPDPLLNNILTASTYPLEVVEADRWLDQPANAELTGDELETALQQKDWDPSVKSLVPFPAILRMMNNQLDWTQQLGDAFLAHQDEVMDMVQQLRRQAEAAGGLFSTPQQQVSTDQQGAVEIAPTNPQDVSVPAYDPNAVYGDWPYPSAPPDAFAAYGPDDIGFGYGDGWYFGPPVAIVTPVWFWGRFDWHHHRIDVNRDRFARLDSSHGFHQSGEWHHDPTHRHGVAYREPGLQQRFAPERTAVLRSMPAAEPSFAAARVFTPNETSHFVAPAGRPMAPPALPPSRSPGQAVPVFRGSGPPEPRPVVERAPRPVFAARPATPAFASAPHAAMPTAVPHMAAPAPVHAVAMPGGTFHGGFQR